MAKKNTPDTTLLDLAALATSAMSTAYTTEAQFRMAELESKERERDRQFQLTAQLYMQNKARQDAWADSLAKAGYMPDLDKTAPGAELIQGNTAQLKQENKIIQANTNKMLQLTAQIEEGKKYGAQLEKQFGSIIPAAKEEIWNDYLLQGGITEETDEDGNIILKGTGEFEQVLSKISPEEYDKLKDKNYRRAVMGGLRTLEQAKTLSNFDQQNALQNLQIQKANIEIQKGTFDVARGHLDAADKQFADMFKTISVGVVSGFNLKADGMQYSMQALQSLDAEDALEVKEAFIKNHPSVANEMEEFINGVVAAKSIGVDASQYLTKLSSKAFEVYLELREYQGQFEKMAEDRGMLKPDGTPDVNALVNSLPVNDPTRSEYKKLDAKFKGFKDMGVYAAGYDVLSRTLAIVQKHGELETTRLNLDMEDAERITAQGYPIEINTDNLLNLSVEEQQEIDISLAALAASDQSGGANLGSLDVSGFTSQQLSQDMVKIQNAIDKHQGVIDQFENVPNKEMIPEYGKAIRGLRREKAKMDQWKKRHISQLSHEETLQSLKVIARETGQDYEILRNQYLEAQAKKKEEMEYYRGGFKSGRMY